MDTSPHLSYLFKQYSEYPAFLLPFNLLTRFSIQFCIPHSHCRLVHFLVVLEGFVVFRAVGMLRRMLDGNPTWEFCGTPLKNRGARCADVVIR